MIGILVLSIIMSWIEAAAAVAGISFTVLFASWPSGITQRRAIYDHDLRFPESLQTALCMDAPEGLFPIWAAILH